VFWLFSFEILGKHAGFHFICLPFSGKTTLGSIVYDPTFCSVLLAPTPAIFNLSDANGELNLLSLFFWVGIHKTSYANL